MSKRVEIIGSPSFADVREGFKKAHTEHLDDAEVVLSEEETEISSKFFRKVDSLAESSKDFSKYVEIFLQELFPEIVDPEIKNRVLTKTLAELSKLDFSKFLFENAEEDLKKIIETYGEKVKAVYLWSQGDVVNTKTQPYKIFLSNLGNTVMKSEEAQVLRGKVFWLVDEDKINKLPKVGKGEKVVVIEDRVSNIENVSNRIGEQASVFPIWTTYASTGGKMRRKKPDVFNEMKSKYNGVESLREIADKKDDFSTQFQDAVVLLDFDGVLMDSDKTKQAYGEVFLKALVSVFDLKDEQRQQLLDKIKMFVNSKADNLQ